MTGISCLIILRVIHVVPKQKSQMHWLSFALIVRSWHCKVGKNLLKWSRSAYNKLDISVHLSHWSMYLVWFHPSWVQVIWPDMDLLQQELAATLHVFQSPKTVHGQYNSFRCSSTLTHDSHTPLEISRHIWEICQKNPLWFSKFQLQLHMREL
jgi:hypothetical protein